MVAGHKPALNETIIYEQEISDSPEGAVALTSLARGLHPLANGYGRNPGLQAGVPTSAPP
jgi:hypothetical protein